MHRDLSLHLYLPLPLLLHLQPPLPQKNLVDSSQGYSAAAVLDDADGTAGEPTDGNVVT